MSPNYGCMKPLLNPCFVVGVVFPGVHGIQRRNLSGLAPHWILDELPELPVMEAGAGRIDYHLGTTSKNSRTTWR